MIEILIFGLFVLAQLADIYTTLRALKLKGAVEGNGFIAFLMDKLGRGWILLKLAISFGGAYAIYLDGRLWLLVLLAAGVFAVAASNYRIIKKLEGRR
ncbi:MAG: DUF5658 family protein [Rhodobacterales bacterium]